MRALIAAAALVLAACGAPQYVANPDEPTFWEVCYDPAGNPVSYSGGCDGPTEITWQLPIGVRDDIDLKESRESNRAYRAVHYGMEKWNIWLDTKVFVPTDDPNPDVIVEALDCGGFCSLAGVAFHTRDPMDGRVTFEVLLIDEYARDTETVAHELGHVLGLAHDPGNIQSIMFPAVTGNMPELSVTDCLALAEKYGLAPPRCT